MAWMATHLFVCSPDHGAVVQATAGLLQEPAHRADHEGLLDRPASVVVTPSWEGWVVITGAGAWLDDLVWAAGRLAVSFTPVISCEVFGNCYRLRLSEHQGGEQVRLVRTPDYGWARVDDDPRHMPLYEDAERLAFQTLAELGVPLPLVTLGTAPLGYPQRPPLDLGQGTRLQPGDEGIGREPMGLFAVPFAGSDPPVLPVSTTRDFGLMLFEERYVDGSPSAAAVDRLLEIEKEILGRARRVAPDGKLSLTVTYHAGVHQERMDALLRQRDRPTLPAGRPDRPPWWQFWRNLFRFR